MRTKKIRKQCVWVGVVLVGAIVFFEYSALDIWVQDHFYNFELKRWILDRDAKIPRFIFYDGIKKVFILSILSIIIALIFFKKTVLIRRYQKGLLIVCLSAIVVPLVVGGLKAVTNTPCPRDLTRYSGRYPHVTVLSAYPQNFEQKGRVKCFPAAHASGGFSLLSMMFLFQKRRSKVIAFFVAMTLGWSTGLYKMLIGDHFLGHTVVTMILACLIILMVSEGVRRYFDAREVCEPKPLKALDGAALDLSSFD